MNLLEVFFNTFHSDIKDWRSLKRVDSELSLTRVTLNHRSFTGVKAEELHSRVRLHVHFFALGFAIPFTIDLCHQHTFVISVLLYADTVVF